MTEQMTDSNGGAAHMGSSSRISTGLGPPSGGTADRLRGTMGTFQLAFMVLAMSAPIGNVIGVLPLGITRGNGIGTPAIYLAIGLVFLVFAVGFTTMTRNLPRAGAFYTYITAGLGRPLGLGAGFLAAATYLVYMVGSYAFLGVSVTNLFRTLDISSPPWWVWGAIGCVIITTLGHFNVELSGKVLAIAMVIEVLLVMLFNVPVLFSGGPHGYQVASFTPSQIFSGDLGVAALFAIACFMGFESSAIYRDEVKDPRRTVPRATYLAIGGLTVFYITTSWALVTFWGVSDVASAGADDPTILFTEGFRFYMGNTITEVMTVLVVSSVFAGALSTHNALSRYLFALGRDGIMPSYLGQAHGKHGSPANASATSTVLAVTGTLIFIGLGIDVVAMYSSLFALGTFSLLVLFTLTTVAVIRYFRLIDAAERRWNTLLAPVLALVGLGTLLVLSSYYFAMSIDGPQWLATLEQIALLVILAGGTVVGVMWRKRRPSVYERIGQSE